MNAKLLRRVRDLLLLHPDRFDNQYTLLIDGTEHECFNDHIGRLTTAKSAKAGLIGWIAYAIVEDGTTEIPSGTRLDEPFVARALDLTLDEHGVLFDYGLTLPEGVARLSLHAELIRIQAVLAMSLFPATCLMQELIGELEKARSIVESAYHQLTDEPTLNGTDYAMYSKLRAVSADILNVQQGLSTLAVRAPVALKALCK